MPDPRVPYPHIVEFGINAGFEKDFAPHIKARFPTPARFNYLRSVSGSKLTLNIIQIIVRTIEVLLKNSIKLKEQKMLVKVQWLEEQLTI